MCAENRRNDVPSIFLIKKIGNHCFWPGNEDVFGISPRVAEKGEDIKKGVRDNDGQHATAHNTPNSADPLLQTYVTQGCAGHDYIQRI